MALGLCLLERQAVQLEPALAKEQPIISVLQLEKTVQLVAIVLELESVLYFETLRSVSTEAGSIAGQGRLPEFVEGPTTFSQILVDIPCSKAERFGGFLAVVQSSSAASAFS